MNLLIINELAVSKRKTKVFEVRSAHDDYYLGTIQWRPTWRHYVFSPRPETDWSHPCLVELAAFIKQLMDERKVRK